MYNEHRLYSNLCRNPTGWHGGAWCYTTWALPKWENCGLPRCSDLRANDEADKMDDKANKKDEVNKMDDKANKKDEVNRMDDDETIQKQAAETGRRDDITVEKMDDEASKMDQANSMDKANKMDNDKTIQRLAADGPEVGRMRRVVLKGKGGL